MGKDISKYDQAMMRTAYVWADLSYCKRRQVGACITRDNGIISHGYNGTAKNQENVCEYRVITCTCGLDIDVSDADYDSVTTIGIGTEHRARATCECGKVHSFTLEYTKLKTHPYVIHAEANAITRAARLGIALEGSTIYTTSLPCNECAKMIVSSGIVRVVYSETYKADMTVKYLRDNGVVLEHLILDKKDK